jgi:hypothetical protein
MQAVAEEMDMKELEAQEVVAAEEQEVVEAPHQVLELMVHLIQVQAEVEADTPHWQVMEDQES